MLNKMIILKMPKYSKYVYVYIHYIFTSGCLHTLNVCMYVCICVYIIYTYNRVFTRTHTSDICKGRFLQPSQPLCMCC